MSDLTDLAGYAKIKVASKHTPDEERPLWAQINREVDAYLYPDDEPDDDPNLFEDP